MGLTPTGAAYEHLLDDMLASPPLAALGLRAAAERAPKESGGLNIEGMTERPDGRSVVIGFRNPRPQGRAIVVPFENPLAVVEGARAQRRCARDRRRAVQEAAAGAQALPRHADRGSRGRASG